MIQAPTQAKQRGDTAKAIQQMFSTLTCWLTMEHLLSIFSKPNLNLHSLLQYEPVSVNYIVASITAFYNCCFLFCKLLHHDMLQFCSLSFIKKHIYVYNIYIYIYQSDYKADVGRRISNTIKPMSVGDSQILSS